MSEPARSGFTAVELLRLKSACEWLTGYYEGASNGRALPKFVHASLAELDDRISQVTPAQAIEAQRAGTVEQGAVADESAVPEGNAPKGESS